MFHHASTLLLLIACLARRQTFLSYAWMHDIGASVNPTDSEQPHGKVIPLDAESARAHTNTLRSRGDDNKRSQGMEM